MIADDGVTPILMDFGSATKARIRVETRSQALLQQVKQTIDSGAGSHWLRLRFRTLQRSRAQWPTERLSSSMSKLV